MDPKKPVDPYDIGEAFAEIEKELIASMIRNMKNHRAEETKEGYEWAQWQAMQLQQLEAYKKANRKKYAGKFKDINNLIDSAIFEARKQGNMEQEIEILEAIKKGFSDYSVADGDVMVEFFKLNDRKLEALIKATKQDFEKAEYAVLRMAEDQYRQIIYNAQVYANTGAATYEKSVDMATKDFLARGIACIEYANGARHTISDWADMSVRTAAKRAYLTGEGEKRKEWGVSTVIMNKRSNPCPKCLPFVGKVLIDDVWSGGTSKDGNYPLMSRAIELGLYHPRCKDSHSTYFEGISTPPDDTFSKKDIDNIKAEYTAEQQSLYAKRQAQKYERLEKHSLDKENKQKYGARAEYWNLEHERLAKADSGTTEEMDIINKNRYSTESGNGVKRIGTNAVDLNYIKSTEFRRKFTNITDNTAVNDSIRKYAEAMLTHRKGTDGEDLYIIDANTGKLLLRKIKGDNNLGVAVDSSEVEYLRENYKGKTIGIHNHPTNIYPTGSDFATAGYRGYKFGVVVTHSGKVFTYESGAKPFLPQLLDSRVDKYTKKPYNYDVERAHKKVLMEFEKEYDIKWMEIK